VAVAVVVGLVIGQDGAAYEALATAGLPTRRTRVQQSFTRRDDLVRGVLTLLGDDAPNL
jgi:hypothetical protein